MVVNYPAQRLLQRLAFDLSTADQFASWSDWLRWLNVSYVSRVRRGFHRPSTAVPIAFARLAQPLFVRPGSHDFAVASELVLKGEYDFIDGLDLGTSPTILDLGANIGAFSRLVLHRWPGARLVAVEPSAGNFETLLLNLGEAPSVACVPAAIGPHPGWTWLDGSADTPRMRTDDTLERGARVRVTTIPELVAERRLEHIDLLKCDIEGAESALFADCSEWIHRVSHLVIEVHPMYGFGFDRLHEALTAAGQRFVRVPSRWSPDTTALYTLSSLG